MRTLVAIVLACMAPQAGAEEPVRPIADVQAMPLDGAAPKPRVGIRGVVTSRRHKPGVDSLLTVEDETAAIWVRVVWEPDRDHHASIRIGSEVEVEGTLDAGGFAPRIITHDVTVLGTRPLPEPMPADIDRLFAGADNARRVSLRAVVQGHREAGRGESRLILATESRRFIANVPVKLLCTSPERLVDSRILVTGIVSAVRNTRGEFLAPEIGVVSETGVIVLEEPPGGPFESRPTSLGAIGRFRPAGDLGRRIRTRGTVNAVFPGDVFYLQQGVDGVRVHARPGERVERGDEVEVAGFIDMSRGSAMLCEAVCRRIGQAEALDPVTIQPSTILSTNAAARGSRKIASPGNYNGCLIEFVAEYVESHAPRDGWCRMTLIDEVQDVTVLLPEEAFAAIASIRPGSVIRCRGVADLKTSSPAGLPLDVDPAVDRVDVLVATGDDVVVVSRPSWWTPRRLGYALAAAITAVAAALVVIQLLRRRIMAQATRIADEIRSGREAAVEYEAALRERTRLASNLHDTVLQTVAGINFQLRACRTASEHDEASLGQHLRCAEQMAEHAVQQLRGNVWALHATSADGASLIEALHALVDRLRAEHPLKVEVRADGREREVSETVAGNLLLVVQEAIHNAVRHGHATLIDVKVVFQPDGGVGIAIRDDGIGFESGTEPGAEQGHFGLDGMRDRMQRMGGTVEVQSEPGEGTRVTACVPAVPGAPPVLEGSTPLSARH